VRIGARAIDASGAAQPLDAARNAMHTVRVSVRSVRHLAGSEPDSGPTT
jgi:hypothetical protein